MDNTANDPKHSAAQPTRLHVLLVAQRPDYASTVRSFLHDARRASFALEWLPSLRSGMERLDRPGVDVVLMDLYLPDGGGLEGFAELRSHAPLIPIIVLSEQDDESLALETVHAGAQDYLVKGLINGPLLTRAILYSIERKKIETDLMRTQQKYRKIFENTVEGIFQTTVDGHYLDANLALARIYGYASVEELMLSLTDIARDLYVEAGRRDEFISLMEKNDVVSGFESKIRRKDGVVIWISENVRAVRDSKKKVMFYEGTVEDITERKKAELNVRNSEALYHSLVETLPQNIFRKNLQEQFSFANSRFCETLGKPIEEILGKTDFDFFPPDLARQYQKDDQDIMRSGRSFETIEEHQPPHGEKIYVNVVKTPLYDASGQIIGLQGIFWDITRRRRAEEALKKANYDLAVSQREISEKNEEMREDLRMARDIQQAILPQVYPVFPRSASPEDSLVQFVHRYIPTGAVGGDFFDFIGLSDTKAGVFICDVMGHGVRAALVTAIIRALVEELTRLPVTPGEVLELINRDIRSILKQSSSPLYTTAFYMVFDLERKEIHYANAGHPKPFHVQRSRGELVALESDQKKNSPALGLFPQPSYPTTVRPFEAGDMFVLFTDGVYDVEHNGDMLDSDWLRQQVLQRTDLSPATMCDEVLAEMRRIHGEGELTDDVCLVTAQISPALES